MRMLFRATALLLLAVQVLHELDLFAVVRDSDHLIAHVLLSGPAFGVVAGALEYGAPSFPLALGAVALVIALASLVDARCAATLARRLLVWVLARVALWRPVRERPAPFAFSLVGAGRGPP